MRKILIAGAWPYANGPLHIGHLAALLPGDVLARYFRAKGEDVYYVSGSDCHGTPVAIRARQEGKTPREVSDAYHEQFVRAFDALGFSYDVYGKTSSAQHREFVRRFHTKLYESAYVYEKSAPQAYCSACGRFLADRLVVGLCPNCKRPARGDQCDECGSVLEAENLLDPACAQCAGPVEARQSKQLYIALSSLQGKLTCYLSTHAGWRKNACAFTKRYIDEGLRDRALTRDLDWGIDVPKEGYEEKKIYIWAENVLGYLSASEQAARLRGTDFAALWGADAKHYYVHGKDNIPFHTIVLPALLLAHGAGLRLPDEIVSSEYMTLGGRKISTSRNWAVWAQELADLYNPDAIRYYFLANGPERRDADFTFKDFILRNNGQLLGGYGNFVNRTLSFIDRYWGKRVPEGVPDSEIEQKIGSCFDLAGQRIEQGRLRDALEAVFELVHYGNKYFDANEPWKTRLNQPEKCRDTLFQCVQILANLSVLLAPFLPFSSQKVMGWLKLGARWQPQRVAAGHTLPAISILFERIREGGQ